MCLGGAGVCEQQARRRQGGREGAWFGAPARPVGSGMPCFCGGMRWPCWQPRGSNSSGSSGRGAGGGAGARGGPSEGRPQAADPADVLSVLTATPGLCVSRAKLLPRLQGGAGPRHLFGGPALQAGRLQGAAAAAASRSGAAGAAARAASGWRRRRRAAGHQLVGLAAPAGGARGRRARRRGAGRWQRHRGGGAAQRGAGGWLAGGPHGTGAGGPGVLPGDAAAGARLGAQDPDVPAQLQVRWPVGRDGVADHAAGVGWWAGEPSEGRHTRSQQHYVLMLRACPPRCLSWPCTAAASAPTLPSPHGPGQTFAPRAARPRLSALPALLLHPASLPPPQRRHPGPPIAAQVHAEADGTHPAAAPRARHLSRRAHRGVWASAGAASGWRGAVPAVS